MGGKIDVARTKYGSGLSIICLVLQALVVVLAAVATPVVAFKRSAAPLQYLTMWGPSRKYSHLDLIVNYTMRGVGCENTKVMITISASFSILVAICALGAFFATLTSYLGCCLATGGYCVAGVLGVSAWIIVLVDWICLVATFNYKCNDGMGGKLPALSEQGYRLDVAPALLVCAWCLETLYCVIIFCL